MTTTSTTAGPAAPARAYKRRISLLVAAHAANDAYPGFLAPVLPILVEHLALPISLAGVLATSLGFTADMGQLFFGYFADRFRRGWLMALGPLCGALVAFMGFMPGFWGLFFLLLVAGAGSACFHPVASVLASQASGSRRGLSVSIYVAGGRLGMAIGAGMATFIVTRVGLDWLPLAAVLGLAVGIPVIFLAPPFEDIGNRAPINFSDTLTSLREVFRPLFLLWVVNLFRTSVTMTVGTYMPLYIVRTGGTLGAGGRAITLFLLAATVGGVFGGHLSDRVGRRAVIIASLVLGTPTLAAALIAAEPYRTLLLVASGALFYAQMGVSVAYAQEIAPAHAALVSSFMLGVLWFAASLVMIGVGALSDVFGLATVLPVFCVASGGIGALFSFRLPKLNQG